LGNTVSPTGGPTAAGQVVRVDRLKCHGQLVLFLLALCGVGVSSPRHITRTKANAVPKQTTVN